MVSCCSPSFQAKSAIHYGSDPLSIGAPVLRQNGLATIATASLMFLIWALAIASLVATMWLLITNA